MFFYEDHTAIGIGLICIGIACYTISVMMFFDRGFMIIANVSTQLTYTNTIAYLINILYHFCFRYR